MVKPKICDILGVEVEELFCISKLRDVKFYIKSDGTFSTIPENTNMSSYWLLRAIERPEYVIKLRNSKLTEDEKSLCNLIKNQLRWAKCIAKDVLGNITIYELVPEFNSNFKGEPGTTGQNCMISRWMLPSLKPCEIIIL